MRWTLLGVVVAAVLGIALEVRRRRHDRRNAPTLCADWKAFIESPARKGEPTIASAAVPAVRKSRATRANRFDLFVAGRRRC